MIKSKVYYNSEKLEPVTTFPVLMIHKDDLKRSDPMIILVNNNDEEYWYNGFVIYALCNVGGSGMGQDR